MTETQPNSPRSPERRRRRVRPLPTALLVLLLAPAVLVYGPWAAMTVRCGHQPVATSTFAAAYSYTTPDRPGYSRFWLFQGFTCSSQEAERNGFHPRP